MPDIVTGKIFVDGERGITATKMNQIISQAVIQTDFYANKSTSSTLDPTDQLLELKGGTNYATITGSQLINSVGANLTPTITAVRLRSLNCVGNPSFEVDQRNVGATVANPASGTPIIDRWGKWGGGTYQVNCKQNPSAATQVVPGTNYRISANNFWVSLTTAQATLGATDYLGIRQFIEGPAFRPLIGDVHSLQILVSSNVAPLKFSIALRDAAASRSLVKLCTLTTAGVWQLITLPNLSVWDAGGTFNITPGLQGYDLMVTLACGSTFIAPTEGVWNAGNYLGASGMDSFVSKATGSNFFIGFIQHEPGSQCTTLMDKPFAQNYDECLRYYQKSYDYGTVAGTATNNGAVSLVQQSTTACNGPARFHKPLAKTPTMTAYSGATGAINTGQLSNGTNYGVTSFNNVGQAGFQGVSTATMAAVVAGANFFIQYTSDSGW